MVRYCKHCLQPLPDMFPSLRSEEWEKTVKWKREEAERIEQDRTHREAQTRRDAKVRKFTGKRKSSYPQAPSLDDL